MIKIAYIIDNIATPSAGTEKQLLMVINKLHKVKFDFTLICLRSSPWLNSNNLPCNIHVLDVQSLKFDFFSGCRKLEKLIKEYKFDVIHALYFDSLMIAAHIINKFPNIVLCTSRRGFINSENKNRLKLFLLRRISSSISAYLCNSKAIGKFTVAEENTIPQKIHVIYNGIELDSFESANKIKGRDILSQYGIEDDNIIITTLANLRPVKNIEFLISSAQQLISFNPKVKIVIIGEGNMRSHLEIMIEDFKLSKHFILLGSYSKPANILAASHIGVLPSKSESLPNALIEYSASKLPSVAADVGGNSEVIIDGISGFLYPSNDRSTFIHIMSKLISDPELRNKLGENGYNYVRNNFSLEVNLKAHEDFYNKIIERGK